MAQEKKPGSCSGESRGTVLMDEMHKLYHSLNRWHSIGVGQHNQIIQRRTEASDKEDSVTVFIEPMGVTVRYSRGIFASRDSEEYGMIKRVDESISFRGTFAPSRSVRHSFLLSEAEGDIIDDPDDPLMVDVDNIDPCDVPSSLMRYYVDVCFEQVASAIQKEGLLELTGEIMAGVKGVRRKLNLGHIEKFNDASGQPYLTTTFQDMILPPLMEQYARISCVEYDKLFILEKDFLIDCGDSSVLESIVAAAKPRTEIDFPHTGKEGANPEGIGPNASLDTAMRFMGAYYNNRGSMSVYEHMNDFVYLLESIFPKEGTVYVYTSMPVVVERIFNYSFDRSAKAHTSIQDGSWLVFDDRGLRIRFLGNAAENEFGMLKKERYEQHKDELKKDRRVDDILDSW